MRHVDVFRRDHALKSSLGLSVAAGLALLCLGGASPAGSSGAGRSDYAAWLSERGRSVRAPESARRGPTYRLTKVLVDPKEVYRETRWDKVDVLEKGGSFSDPETRREEATVYVPVDQWSTRPVKVPMVNSYAQEWQVRFAGERASLAWSEVYTHSGPAANKPHDPAIQTLTRSGENSAQVPAVFSLGETLVLSFDHAYSATSSSAEEQEFNRVSQYALLNLYGSRWLALTPQLEVELPAPVNSIRQKFDLIYTPRVTDSGVWYGVRVVGAIADAVTENSRDKMRWMAIPESQVLTSFDKPPSELTFQFAGYQNTGPASIDLVYTLEKAPRFWKCEPLAFPVADGELAPFVAEHRQLAEKLQQVFARPLPEKRPGEADAAYDSRVLQYLVAREKDAVDLDREMRVQERFYFEKLAEKFGTISEPRSAAIRDALHGEAVCLAKAVTEALDEMRAQTFRFVENSEYFRKRRLYDAYLRDLQHVLSLWSTVNRLEALRYEMLISEQMKAKAGGDADFHPATLAGLQLALKNILVDDGWIALVREQALAQDAIDARDCYGEGLKAAKKGNERLPWQNEFLSRTGQRAIYGTQYVMAVFNTMWTTFVDSIARLVNWSVSWSDRLSGLIETVHEAADRQIREIQSKSADRIATVEAVRGFGAEQTRALGNWLAKDGAAPYDERKLRDLDDHRMFHEATSGGLLRFAVCLDTEWDEILDKEYRIASKHGRLVWNDMRVTVHMREGREASGNDPLLKRMIDPLGTWKSACAHMRGNYNTMEDYLAERSGQLDEMEGLRPRLLLMHYDLDYLERKLPQNYRIHYTLAQRNPDYMAFLERHRALWAKRQEDVLHAEIARATDDGERQRLAFKISLLQRTAPMDAQGAMPAILKQQLLDRVAVLDFDGAVGIARELENIEPEAARGLSAWLANDLAWEHAKEIGVNTWVSLGNGGLYTAFFTRYISPAAVRNQRVSFANARKIFSTWNGFNNLLQFMWGRVNPFSSLTKGELTTKRLGEVSLQITKAAAEQVEQEAIGRGILTGYFGVDEKYADFLANTIVNMQQVQTDDPGSLANTTSRNLLRRLDAYVPERIDVPGWRKVATARGMMREYWQAMDARAELERAMLQLEDATRGGTWDDLKVGPIVKLVSRARLKLNLIFNPLNEASIRAALDDYEARVLSATGEEAMKARVELFKLLPMPALMQAKKEGRLPRPLELKIDNARREILRFAQTEFLARHPGLALHVERIIFTGSGARPDWPEYKRLSSDLDLTIVLKEGTPLATRAQVKATFDDFFRQKAGFAPEEFDIHCFADERPRLSARGITVEGLLEMVKDPAEAARLTEEGRRNLDSLLRDLADPERYLSNGALRFLHYLNKLGGRVKRPEGQTLFDDENYQRELYKDVKFEPWMGLEMVMDNLKMVGAHSGSRLDYAKSLAKYGLRVLFARVIQSERGMKMVNELTVEEIERNIASTGGIHGEFVRMAEQLGGRFTPDQLRLFREMNLRKQGRPWSEVFEERLGRKVAENDPALNAVIDKHIAEMEGFVRQSLQECVVTNATHMKQLADAIEAAGDATPDAAARKEALTLKYREILFSVATVWNSLSDVERRTVLGAAPAESDFFAALEDVRNAIKKRDLDLIRNYKPFRRRGGTPMDDDR